MEESSLCNKKKLLKGMTSMFETTCPLTENCALEINEKKRIKNEQIRFFMASTFIAQK
jgi:hypothetical protein